MPANVRTYPLQRYDNGNRLYRIAKECTVAEHVGVWPNQAAGLTDLEP